MECGINVKLQVIYVIFVHKYLNGYFSCLLYLLRAFINAGGFFVLDDRVFTKAKKKKKKLQSKVVLHVLLSLI